MTPGRIIHGRDAEPRRLYNFDPSHRSRKRHVSGAWVVGLVAFVAGLILGSSL